MPTNGFSFDELVRMTDGVPFIGNNYCVPCPICGPQCRSRTNQRRKVLALKPHDDGNGMVYHCHRCEIRGSAFRNRRSEHQQIKIIKTKEHDNSKVAAELWERAVPMLDTPAQLYLRQRQCDVESLNIRFLKASGKYHNAMIARFSSKDGSTKGVHLTRINLDGSKIDIEPVKIMLGPSSGWPIILSSGGDTLCIAEGIEDSASMALAMDGAGAWAAGSAGRIAACLRRAKMYSRIIVAVDPDSAGDRALAAARKVRPDLLAVRFQIDGNDFDANATLQRYGVDAVASCIAFAKRRAA